MLPAFLSLNRPFSGQPDNHIPRLNHFDSICINYPDPKISVKNIENWWIWKNYIYWIRQIQNHKFFFHLQIFMGYHEWNSIFMITLVFSPKFHLPNNVYVQLNYKLPLGFWIATAPWTDSLCLSRVSSDNCFSSQNSQTKLLPPNSVLVRYEIGPDEFFIGPKEK